MTQPTLLEAASALLARWDALPFTIKPLDHELSFDNLRAAVAAAKAGEWKVGTRQSTAIHFAMTETVIELQTMMILLLLKVC